MPYTHLSPFGLSLVVALRPGCHLQQINTGGQVLSGIERDALHRELQRTQGTP